MENTGDIRDLRELVRTLEKKLGMLQDNEVSCCSISATQCFALVEVGRVKSINLNDLSRALGLEDSTVCRTVNNLVAKEMVCREIDPKDRRYMSITLTDNGRKIYDGIEGDMNLYFSQVLGNIPKVKHGQVLESLQLLVNAIEQCDIQGNEKNL